MDLLILKWRSEADRFEVLLEEGIAVRVPVELFAVAREHGPHHWMELHELSHLAMALLMRLAVRVFVALTVLTVVVH